MATVKFDTTMETLNRKIQVLTVLKQMFDQAEYWSKSRCEHYRKNQDTGEYETVTTPYEELDDDDRAYIDAVETVKQHLLKLA